jgi:hypothetical protein
VGLKSAGKFPLWHIPQCILDNNDGKGVQHAIQAWLLTAGTAGSLGPAPDIMALVWLQPSVAAARRAPVLTALCAATSALATAVLLRAQISPAVAVVAAAAAARPEAPTVAKGSKGTTGSQVHSLRRSCSHM